MALPLAHAAAGYLVYEGFRPAGPHRPYLLGVAIGLANAPDLDFVPGLLLGRPELFHRGVTHSLGAVVLVAVGAAVAVALRGASARGVTRAALFVAVAWASHLVVDFFTVDVVAPHGAPLLWPLSSAYLIASRPLLDEIVIDASGRVAFFASLFTPHTVTVWAEELGLLLCAVGGAHAARALTAALVQGADRVEEGR